MKKNPVQLNKNVRLDQAFKPARVKVNPIKLSYGTRQPDGQPHSDLQHL